MLFDLKILKATLEQIEQEKKIPQKTLIDALEQALGAAYKRDYGRKGQIIRSKFDMETGDVIFYQVKTVVDETTVRPELTEAETEAITAGTLAPDSEEELLPRYDEEKHMYLSDAKLMKSTVVLGDEMVFPLEAPEKDFGRVAAQTAKQVIMQRIREAEHSVNVSEFLDKKGTILHGSVQKVDRGNVFVELGKGFGILTKTEQIPGETWKTGDHIKCYLYDIEQGPKGVMLKLSRSHPRFIEALFMIESPEVASGVVEIKAIAREAGARSKIAVYSNDSAIDPIGACVGQRGGRVSAVTGELSGEKIDIIPWSANTAEFIANAIAPAQVIDIRIDEENHQAHVDVASDQLSLAIGKKGQNARLAVQLTGWRIDIKGIDGIPEGASEESGEDEGFTTLDKLFTNTESASGEIAPSASEDSTE